MDKMEITYSKCFPPNDESEQLLIGEGVENCVCKNLFSEIFLPTETSQEMSQNRLVAKKITDYKSFLLPSHLELKPSRINTERLQQACYQLEQLDQMKTPKGKLNLVINSAKAISLMLQETSVSGDPDGADMFFPTQIYAIFQLQSFDHLMSNLVYIRYFRGQTRLTG